MDSFVLLDPGAVVVRLVDELPTACGGAVVWLDHDGVRWMLLEPRPECVTVPDHIDMHEWADRGRAMNALGEEATAADFARFYGVAVEEAQAVFWSAAFEWLERTAPAWAD